MSINTFISYSHDSIDHKQLVLSLANQLRAQGIDCTIDQYDDSPEEGWVEWMESSISNSSYVLVVCTEAYLNKLGSKQGEGKGVKWEGAIITQEIYDNFGKNRKFIPVIFGQSNKDFIPRVLKSYTYYNVLEESGYERLYRRLTKQPSIKKPHLGNLIQFPEKPVGDFGKNNRSKGQAAAVNQTATGNNNIQISGIKGGVSFHTRSNPKISMLPPIGTIGANSLLKQSIKERFNKIGEEREKRFGKAAYSVMYKNFKRDFEIKNNAWTVIWEWPEETVNTIINYLDEKYANTIAGRIEKAIKKGTMIPAKGYLYAQEKKLLAELDLKISSPEVKEALHKYFGVTTHTKLTKSKHWQWVLYLEAQVRKYIGE